MIFASGTQFHTYLLWVDACLVQRLNRFLNVKAVVAAFNQEKAVIIQLQTSRRFISSSSSEAVAGAGQPRSPGGAAAGGCEQEAVPGAGARALARVARTQPRALRPGAAARALQHPGGRDLVLLGRLIARAAAAQGE